MKPFWWATRGSNAISPYGARQNALNLRNKKSLSRSGCLWMGLIRSIIADRSKSLNDKQFKLNRCGTRVPAGSSGSSGSDVIESCTLVSRMTQAQESLTLFAEARGPISRGIWRGLVFLFQVRLATCATRWPLFNSEAALRGPDKFKMKSLITDDTFVCRKAKLKITRRTY